MITIAVSNDEEEEGEEEKTLFVVHKHYLCSTSRFFKAAFEGPWKDTADAKAGRFPLREFDPRHFDAYVHWVYKTAGTSTIDITTLQGWEDDALEPSDQNYIPQVLIPHLLRFHERAGFLSDDWLQGAIVTTLQSYRKTFFSTDVILEYWDTLESISDLRTFFKSILSERAAGDPSDEWPEAVVREVMIWQSRAAKKSRSHSVMGQLHDLQSTRRRNGVNPFVESNVAVLLAEQTRN